MAQWFRIRKTFNVNGKIVEKVVNLIDHKRYDRKGNLVYWAEPMEHTAVKFDYDTRGNLVHTQCFDSDEASFECDEAGRTVHEQKLNGTECWYDTRGNTVRTKDSDGVETWYEYDESGNCICKKDSDGYEWWYNKR